MRFLDKILNKPELLPHEVNPELLEWEINDDVLWYSHEYGRWGTYLGILEGLVYVDEKTRVRKFTPRESKLIINKSLQRRQDEAERKRVREGIKTDHYNQFLQIVKENQKQLAEDWFSENKQEMVENG